MTAPQSASPLSTVTGSGVGTGEAVTPGPDRALANATYDTTSRAGAWSRANHVAALLDIARALPANLGVEFTAEHGWRIITIGVETRHFLELLDITEGDVIPDPVMREHRRRHVEAHLVLEQAQAVLRAVQAENETRCALRERVAS